ncbi:MAG: heat-inducible transcription repressor HrcA [Clostridia bacterium]|nr:heat-inducible transcription repressor HrcA [Clostridia bacterium]
MDERYSDLTPRKKLILKCIIEEYIRSGEPVGSKLLTQNKQIGLSSASIRSEMAELESLGYLRQPHTSAGRVPSEAGYRFYVNELIDSYSMTATELEKIDSLKADKRAELDSILEKAAHLMGSVTNYPALTFRNPTAFPVIQKFKIVQMHDRRFLLIMVVGSDQVRTEYVDTDVPVSESLLGLVEDALNRYLANKSITNLTLPFIMEMQSDLPESAESVLNRSIKVIYKVIRELGSGELHFDGVNKLLQYHEYKDIDMLRGILGAIEESRDEIVQIVRHPKQNAVNVFIGSENSVDLMRNSTLIFRPIIENGRVVGAIGVIGPCRMDYSKVITTVDYLSEHISKMINTPLLPEFKKGDNEE